jgi:sugar O-acyltransferase (sialic acid O-acetyltransferase NeuD family)
MVIFGASGFAFECFEVAYVNGVNAASIHFFDDVNAQLPALIDQYELTVYRHVDELRKAFPNGFEGVIGTGNPRVRKILTEKLELAGGTAVSLISKDARIGYLGNAVGKGCCIMTGVVITSNCTIEDGVLLNLNATVGHDSFIGAYTEICPGVNISGKCTIGKEVFIGTGAVILPGITVGDGAVIAAGAIVTKDVAPRTLVAGNPAIWKKDL